MVVKTDYSKALVSAACSVLIELMRILGEYSIQVDHMPFLQGAKTSGIPDAGLRHSW